MVLTAGVASVEMIKFTGSPPFDVDGAVSLAQRGRAVNIDDLPQGRSSPTASLLPTATGCMPALQRDNWRR
jgi:hypothetical protein